MKLLLLGTAVMILATSLVTGQTKRKDELEQEIKKLDLAAADAIQRKDVATMNKLFAEDFTVNSPGNVIVKNREEVYSLIRNGIVNYTSFVREPETILFYGNTAVVMGQETIKRNDNAAGTEQTVRRRYTNIWVKKNGKWLLTARHASIICPS